MANRIKGITIEIGGETTKLEKSLKKVNSTISQSQTKLRDIDRLLKLDPSNVDLLRQKQSTLQSAIAASKDKTTELRAALDQLKETGGDDAKDQIEALEREIIATENQTKKFEAELKALGNVNLRALGTKMQAVGGSIKQAGESMKYVSAAAAGAVAALAGIAYKAGVAADDLNTLSKQTHISTQDLQIYAGAAELVDVPVETLAAAHQKLTKSMAGAKDGTGSAADAFKALGVSVVDANGNLRSSDEVFNDAINALGGIQNEAERDAAAMAIFGKSATELNPLIMGGTEALEGFSDKAREMGLVLDQETLDAANKFNDTIDQTKALTTMAFTKMGASLAQTLQPALEKVAAVVVKVADAFSNLSPTAQKVIIAVGGIIAVLSPVLIVIGAVISAIGSIVTAIGVVIPAITAVGGVVAAIGAPVALAIAAAGALIFAFVKIAKNGDKLKAKLAAVWNGIKSGIKSGLGKVAAIISAPFVNAYNRVKAVVTNIKNAVDKIKSFWNFKVPTPHVPLPHFSISPPGWKIGDLTKGKIPKLGVKWFAKGGIVNGATLIGAGERGAEGIIPLDPFWSRLDAWGSAMVKALNQAGRMGGAGEIRIVNEIGGVKVGEQIVRLYDRSKLALG